MSALGNIINDGGVKGAFVVLILVFAYKIYRAKVITDMASDCCTHHCKLRTHTQNDGGNIEINQL